MTAADELADALAARAARARFYEATQGAWRARCDALVRAERRLRCRWILFEDNSLDVYAQECAAADAAYSKIHAPARTMYLKEIGWGR